MSSIKRPEKKTAKMEAATVVSAYYTFPSKFPPQQYFQWIQNFLENIPCYLVFFTTAELLPLLEPMRSKWVQRTRFIVLPTEEWVAFKKYGRAMWEKQKELDTETKHSADLYAVWYEKKEFVRRAIEANPFQTEKFVWCDAGAFRYPQWLPHLQNFALAPRIPENRLLLLQIDPFTPEEKAGTDRDFRHKNRIGGGIQAGSVEAWRRWSELYDQQLEDYLAGGKFVGKDQSIMAEIVLNHPEAVLVVPPIQGIPDVWFSLLFVLGARKPFEDCIYILIPLYNGIEFLDDALQSVKSQTYKNWKVLVGINGWPANSHVYQAAYACAASHSPNIHVLDFPELKSKPETLNRLQKIVLACGGKWLALLDCDDVWHPQKLEIQSHFLGEYDVVGSQARYFGSMDGSPKIALGDITEADFWRSNPLLNSSVVMRADLGPWNEANRILEDYEYWLRLRYRQEPARFYNCPEPLLFHRIHPTSAFNNRNSEHLAEFKAHLQKELA